MKYSRTAYGITRKHNVMHGDQTLYATIAYISLSVYYDTSFSAKQIDQVNHIARRRSAPKRPTVPAPARPTVPAPPRPDVNNHGTIVL